MKNSFNNISQEEKNRILEMHSGNKTVISEQSTPNVSVDCLLKAGFKLEDVGGPMTRYQVYSGKMNGKNYQFTKEGFVRIFSYNDKNEQRGVWVCDPNSPNGIKISNITNVGRQTLN
jgi:hypothetical protein